MPRKILAPGTGEPLRALFQLIIKWRAGCSSQALQLAHPLDQLLLPADLDELEVMTTTKTSYRPIGYLMVELDEQLCYLDDEEQGLLRRWGGLGCRPESLQELAKEMRVDPGTMTRRIQRGLNDLGDQENKRLREGARPGDAVAPPGPPTNLEALFASTGFLWLLGRSPDPHLRDRWSVLGEVAETVRQTMAGSGDPHLPGIEVLAKRAAEGRRRIGPGDSQRRFRLALGAYPILALGAEQLALEEVRDQRRRTTARIEAVVHSGPKRLFPHVNIEPTAKYLARLPERSKELLDLRRPNDRLFRDVVQAGLGRLASEDVWAEEAIINSYVARFPVREMATLALYDRYVIGRARRSSGKQRIPDALLATERLGPQFAPELDVLNGYDLAVLLSSHGRYEAAAHHLDQAQHLIDDPRVPFSPARRAGLASRIAHGRTMLLMAKGPRGCGFRRTEGIDTPSH